MNPPFPAAAARLSFNPLPAGHFYIDDLAVCPYQGSTPLSLAKQTGFYETPVKAVARAGGAGPGVVLSAAEKAKAAQAAATAPCSAAGGFSGASTQGPASDAGFWKGLLMGAGLATLAGYVATMAKHRS